MKFPDPRSAISVAVKNKLPAKTRTWLTASIEQLSGTKAKRKLYLTYSKLNKETVDTPLSPGQAGTPTANYLNRQKITERELARLHLLTELLQRDPETWRAPVGQLIEVADTGELVTFLKFLPLLPHPEDYANTAVEALRTNIVTVFDAISQANPYPAEHFTDEQWNQMFLKAAFMQRPLGGISSIDERANADLARIISDYAHERWAAGRDVDPLFWRPTAKFLQGDLLSDMKKLLASDNERENKAAALCCYHSENPAASSLLDKPPELKEAIDAGDLTWATL